MDSHEKVMAPYVKHLGSKKKLLDISQNPYMKLKNVEFYKQLSRRMEELKITLNTMNNLFIENTK